MKTAVLIFGFTATGFVTALPTTTSTDSSPEILFKTNIGRDTSNHVGKQVNVECLKSNGTMVNAYAYNRDCHKLLSTIPAQVAAGKAPKVAAGHHRWSVSSLYDDNHQSGQYKHLSSPHRRRKADHLGHSYGFRHVFGRDLSLWIRQYTNRWKPKVILCSSAERYENWSLCI